MRKIVLTFGLIAGAIVSLFKRLKAEGGEMVLVGARDQPLAVLKLLRLDRVFHL